MNNETEVLKKVSDVTLEEPISITVDVKPMGWIHRRLQKWGVIPKKRVFELKPITLGSLIRISKYLLEIDIRIPDRDSILDANYRALTEHGEKLAIVIALAIRNSKAPVDKNLVEFIKQNFTPKEILAVLGIVIRQMDITNFMSSIISVRGMNVLVSNQPASAMNVNQIEVSL
jgi:hypothetical protein